MRPAALSNSSWETIREETSCPTQSTQTIEQPANLDSSAVSAIPSGRWKSFRGLYLSGFVPTDGLRRLILALMGRRPIDTPVINSGLKSVCENSVLEGHGFSRAVSNMALPGFSR